MDLPHIPDPRREANIKRYKPTCTVQNNIITDYLNVLSILLSTLGVSSSLKWISWLAVYCSILAMSNLESISHQRRVLTSCVLSIFGVGILYAHNHQPIDTSWLF